VDLHARRLLAVPALLLAVPALLLAVPALLLAAGAAAAQESVRVEEIVVEGNRRFSTENVKYAMRTKEGKVLDRDLLSRDQSMLYAFFERISIREEPLPGGVRLVLTVEENPLVSRVEFVGVTAFLEEELRPLVETRTGYPLAPFRLENDLRLLRARYRDDGYHWAQVDASILEDEGARRVVIRIVEGPWVEVDGVVVRGAGSLAPKKAIGEMSNRPGWFLDGTPFVEARLEEDMVAIALLYREEGFLDARAWVEGVDFDVDRDDATIRVAVEEGEPWTVGEVQVVGGEGLRDRAAVAAETTRLEPGARWRERDLRRVQEEMQAEARRQGFSDARVEAERIPRPGTRILDVRLLVAEGKRFTVRFLDVNGNVVTQDRVVLREFTVAPGEPLDSSALQKSARRVLDTGYFTSAIPRIRDTEDPDRKDVEVVVEESPRTSQFRFGFGISSDTGVFGSFSVIFRNFDIADVPARFGDFADGRGFKGAGQTLAIDLMPGTEVSRYRIGFTEPWFLDKPVSVGFDIYKTESLVFAYDEDRDGVELRAERRWLVPGKDLDDSFSVGIRPRAEVVEVSNIDRDAPPNAYAIEGRNNVFAAALDLSWRRTDQESATERGWRATLTSEVAGGPVGGDFEFWKNHGRVERFFTLWRDADERPHTVMARVSGGVAMPLGDPGEDVPLPERLFAGGASGIGAVRGYAYTGLGPHGRGDPSKTPWKVRNSIEANYGEPMGGDALAVGALEYGFPFVGDVLRGAVFTDAGNLQFNTGALRDDWRWTAGFGILLKIPFMGPAPLRFDFAWPIRSVHGDERQVLSFEFSRYF
jgi:outer membrane protein insertion porin family